MEKNVVYVRQAPKADTIDRWAALAKVLFGKQAIGLVLTSNVTGFEVRLNGVPADNAIDHPNLQQFKNSVTSALALQIESMSIALNVAPHGSRTLAYSTSDTGFGKILLSMGDQPQTWAGDVMNAISQTFDVIPYPQIVSETVPKLQLDSIKLQEQLLSALSAEVSKTGQHVLAQQDRFGKFLVEAQGQLNEHRQQLEEDDRKRQAEAESVRKQYEEEHRKRLAVLEEREHEYDRKVQALNLRENTTERRDRMKGLTEWLKAQQEFKLSSTTDEKRKPVMYACWAAMTVGVVIAFGFAYRLLSSPDWKFVPAVTTGLVIAASTFVYYVKWSDQWFKEHARAEMRSRRLEADIQRAAWLSEMFFETKDKQLPESFFEHFAVVSSRGADAGR